MSSLLSGIRFVPRAKEEDISDSKRDKDKDGSTRDGKDRKREKEKKHKSKKHKKDHKHKSSKKERGIGFTSSGSKRDRRRSSSSSSGSDDSDDSSEASRYKGEDDFKEFRDELEQEERMKQQHRQREMQARQSQSGSSYRYGAPSSRSKDAYGTDNNASSRYGDVDFSQGLYEYVPSDDSASGDEYNRQDASRDRGYGNRSSNNTTAAASASVLQQQQPTKTNQSVAAMLREKLKASKAALPVNINAQQTMTAVTGDAKVHVNHDPYAIAKKLIDAKKAGAGGETSALPDAKRARVGGKDEPPSTSSSANPSTRDDFMRLKQAEKWDKTNMDDVFVSNVLRLGSNYKGTELGDPKSVSGGTGFDEEEDVDMKMFLSVDDRMGSDQARDRDASRAKHAAEKRESIVSRCFRCIESSNHSRDLTVSVSEHAYLRVKPSHLSLVSFGHCEIIPIEHCSSTLRAGEEALIEIGRYKSCLEAMFEREGKVLLFLESAVRESSLSGAASAGNKGRPRVGGSSGSSGSGSMRHTVIDVVPIDKRQLQEAIVYFREAFLTCDEEWSTHKKLIDLSTADANLSSRYGRVHAKVPGHMSYVAVEWPGGGYAHVVENEEQFNEDFLLDVLSGYFQDIPYHMRRRQKSDKTKDVGLVKQFKGDYDMFDWVGYALEGAQAE